MSSHGNQYLLVAQDYFSKWPFVRALPDQKADTIVQTLRDEIFSLVGPPQKLHSDQGRNFESKILGDLCKAFGAKKVSHNPYHPMGDGLVERMNRSLLNLFHSHINPPSLLTPNLPGAVTPEPTEYSARLKCKLLELREMVDTNIVESAKRQCQSYRGSETRVKLRTGQQVLLNNPTKGKLDPRWTGPWTISDLKGPSTVLLRMGTTKRAVHINRVCPFLSEESGEQQVSTVWTPPVSPGRRSHATSVQ